MNYITKLSFNNVYQISTIFNDINYYLTSHRLYESEKLLDNESKIHINSAKVFGQEWIFNEIYNGLYEIIFNNDININSRIGYYLYADNDNNIFLSKNKKSLWKLEKINNSGFQFYIKNPKNNYYLIFDENLKRDKNSFYISLNDKSNNCVFSMKKILKKNNVLTLNNKNNIENKNCIESNEISSQSNLINNNNNNNNNDYNRLRMIRLNHISISNINFIARRNNNIIHRINISGGHSFV